MSTYLPEELHEVLCAWIEALTVSDRYKQLDTDAWRRAEVPIALQREPAGAAHLAFSIDDRSTLDGGAWGDEGTMFLEDVLEVQFLFLVRPEDQDGDWRRAKAACHCLAAHLLDQGAHGYPGNLEVIVPDRSELWRRDPTATTDFLLCKVFIRVQYRSLLTTE